VGPIGTPVEAVVSKDTANGVNGVRKDSEGDVEMIFAPESELQLVPGVINDLSIFERGDKGKDGLCVVAAVGKEHRLGRYKTYKGKNGAVVLEVKRKALTPLDAEEELSGDEVTN
jgi:ribosomal RNA-processing protein 9